ncbi:MAG TPA: M23 family metallopeptidase, partial [Actinomycetota bacterium]|nr:M23 family metallopeptidase [Actinomycetota bacterium]
AGPRAAGPALLADEVGAPVPGSYAWPVLGPVLRPFEPPSTPFGAGHRGIDIGAPVGTPVRAAQAGVVAFAGAVAGSLFVSIDHADGVRTTYSWVSAVLVVPGQAVARGQVVARTGQGHPGSAPPHLHFGARLGDLYLDPMLLLGPRSVVGLVHLAPLEKGP